MPNNNQQSCKNIQMKSLSNNNLLAKIKYLQTCTHLNTIFSVVKSRINVACLHVTCMPYVHVACLVTSTHPKREI